MRGKQESGEKKRKEETEKRWQRKGNKNKKKIQKNKSYTHINVRTYVPQEEKYL